MFCLGLERTGESGGMSKIGSIWKLSMGLQSGDGLEYGYWTEA
jgi:hypothetical protein